MKKDYIIWHKIKRAIEHKEKSVAILSQVRLFDAKRIKYKIGMINEKDFIILKEKIRQLFT